MLEKLSPEQEALMYSHRDEYIDFIVNNKGRSRNMKVENLRGDINWIYSKANLEAPKYIFVADSYMEEKLMINFILNSGASLFEMEDLKAKVKKAINKDKSWKADVKNILDHAPNEVKDTEIASMLERNTDINIFSEIQEKSHAVLMSEAETALYGNLFTVIRQNIWRILSNETNNQLVSTTSRRNTSKDAKFKEVSQKLFAQVQNQIEDDIDKEIEGNTKKDLLTKIGQAMINTGYQAMYNNVCQRIYNETLTNMQGKKMEFIEQEFGMPWNSWLSFYSYFQKIGIVTSQDFDRYYKFMRNGIWSIQFFKHWCILTPLPDRIHRDNQNRLHSTDSSAVEWIGSKFSDHHFIHGVSFPDKNLWERVVTGKITAREILNEVDNMEQRNAILSIYPPEKLIKELDAKLISTHKQEKKGKLYLRVEDYKKYTHKPIKLYTIDPTKISSELGREMLYILFYTDPSTGREYFSYIEPRAAQNGAAAAMAWKFGLSEEEYLNDIVAET